jgi:hypothetical protein
MIAAAAWRVAVAGARIPGLQLFRLVPWMVTCAVGILLAYVLALVPRR